MLLPQLEPAPHLCGKPHHGLRDLYHQAKQLSESWHDRVAPKRYERSPMRIVNAQPLDVQHDFERIEDGILASEQFRDRPGK